MYFTVNVCRTIVPQRLYACQVLIKRKTWKNRTKDMLIVVLVKKPSREKIGFDFVMNSEILNTGRIAKIVQ